MPDLDRTEHPAEGDPPRVTLLVGMPGSGKSTWTAFARAQGITRPTRIISSDDQVADVARQTGLSFSEAFKRLDGWVVARRQRAALRAALKAGEDVIIDKINASPRTRAKMLCGVPSHYEKHAVVFQVPEDELARRRGLRPGKVIPREALAEMRAAYKKPAAGEFDFVHQAGLAKRKAGTPLSEAELQQRRDAAQARWAVGAAGVGATGAVVTAAAGEAHRRARVGFIRDAKSMIGPALEEKRQARVEGIRA